jgi:hypothetical protein
MISGRLFSSKTKITINGKTSALLIEETETMRVERNTRIKKTSITKKAAGNNAITTPTSEATPLPPRKPANTG